MADLDNIAKEFANYYYTTFDNDRKALAPLYSDVSMMTWEGTQHLGTANIMEKLVTLPFQRIAHKITTIDTQPSIQGTNAIIISITGQLMFDDEPKPQQFCQTFQLVNNNNSFFIFNDVFRLNYA
ncbi:Nuclear transport factor 2 [Coemansia brasiliensis]|uniref:Nuclear transport factor 2 n=1 Tax=Coemansia brasiliensis TaxID=2650707 RepID=A0A9W8LYF5_9FUNG|nr:Nuclear transport factor 2 [Coemansia brasiliensis]